MAGEPAAQRRKRVNLRPLVKRIILVIAVAVGVLVGVNLLLVAGVPIPDAALRAIEAALVFFGTVAVVRQIATTIRKAELPSPSTSGAMANIVSLTGLTFAGLGALAVFGVTPEVLFATGAFAGIVVGLGLQPVLINFFAGLIIIFGRYVTPGMEISILSANVNISASLHPHYRFVQRDYLYGGYRGRVQDVGLIYSSLLTSDALEVRISNGLLLNAAIVDHKGGVNHVRYEFGVEYSPELVLPRAKEALDDLEGILGVHVDEQLDKDFYFVVVTFQVAPGEDWRDRKSEILTRLIDVQRALLKPVVETPAAPVPVPRDV